MTRIDVVLSDDLGAWLEARAAEMQMDVNEYVIALLRRERPEAEKLARLQDAIAKGRASGISERNPFEYIKTLKIGLRGSADTA